MIAVVTNIGKAALFAAVALSGIVSIYAATNTFSVYTNLDVFLSGMLVIVTAVLAGPLFCYFAVYGLVFYYNRSTPVAVAVVTPILVAWCVGLVRSAVAYLKGD